MDGVSFIVTLFNKRPFLPRVVAALARQRGPYSREFVFVDDGSSDGSGEFAARLTAGWEDRVTVLRQENRGASAATNLGAACASQVWLKLVDGDDLLVPGATANLLEAARASGLSFAYGALDTYDTEGDGDSEGLSAAPGPRGRAAPSCGWVCEEDGLARFIRNCPANSSAILVSKARFEEAGGCDERLVSPDQALFLRLFARGGAARLEDIVALVPKCAPGRLSDDVRRSRYESVLALYYLVTETPGLSPVYARLACVRALSRARRFARRHGRRSILSGHLLSLAASRLGLPIDPARAIEQALGAFTRDGRSERPREWLPGAAAERRAAGSGG